MPPRFFDGKNDRQPAAPLSGPAPTLWAASSTRGTLVAGMVAMRPKRCTGDHGLRPGRARRRGRLRVEKEGVRVDVGEHGRGAEAHDDPRGGEERERRRHHLVAVAHAQRHEGHQERIGSRRDAHDVAASEKLGQGVLELVDLGSHDEVTVLDDSLHCGQELVVQRIVLL